MGQVKVRLPAVLAERVGGERWLDASGQTIGEALNDLVRQRPALALHFFDEGGAIRRHILCFHNEVYARGAPGLERPVEPGDTLTILNSVSGG